MNVSTSNFPLRGLVVSVLASAGALLTACGHPALDGTANASAAMPMSTPVAMGPVYFGDTMSFGAEVSAAPATLMADNKSKAPGF